MDDFTIVWKSGAKRKKRKTRKKQREQSKSNPLKAHEKQKRNQERERQLKMHKQYVIALLNNDKATMKRLLDQGYKLGGCGKSGRGKYNCSNPRPYSGGSFTSK